MYFDTSRLDLTSLARIDTPIVHSRTLDDQRTDSGLRFVGQHGHTAPRGSVVDGLKGFIDLELEVGVAC